METDNNTLQKVQRVAQANRKRLLLFSIRPQPPRGVKFNTQGYVAWDEPSELRNITHYNVYSGNDTTLYRRYPVGTKLMNDLMPSTTLIWVSAFNEESGLESHKISAASAGSSTGSTGIPGAPTVPAGPAPIVTGLTATNERSSADQNGEMVRLKASFTLPTVVSNYTGARAVAQASGDTSWILLGDLGATETTINGPWMPSPHAGTLWTIKVQSYNADTILNPMDGSTPTATTTIAAGVAGYDLTKVLAGTYDSVTFGLVGGKFVVTGVDLTKSFNVDLTQFNVAGGFQVRALSAGIINAGILKVGGTSGFAGQVFVVDSDNVSMVGWIGVNSGIYGGWFKNLYLGGTSPSNALVNVVSGTVNIKGTGINVGPGTNGDNGQITLYNSASIYGWLGSSGGFTGAWFQNLWVGGTDPSTAKIIATGGGVSLLNTTLTLTLGSTYQVDINTTSGLSGFSAATALIVRNWATFGSSSSQPDNATEVRDSGLYISGRLGGSTGFGPYPTVQFYNSGGSTFLYMYGMLVQGFPQVRALLEAGIAIGGKLHLYDTGGTERITLNGGNGNFFYTGNLCTSGSVTGTFTMPATSTRVLPVYSADGGTFLGYIPLI